MKTNKKKSFSPVKRTAKRTVYGTSYFVSHLAARTYYALQGETWANVDTKIKEGSIHIGEPKPKKGEKLLCNASEGRYFIETSN